MNKLHPGAKWVFRIESYIISLVLAAFLVVFTFSSLRSYITPLMVLPLIVLVLVLGEVYSQMSYNRWFYDFNDEGLRLERGIIWKRYSNIPYERIQNVDVHRGVFARMFGFSTVMVQTAGYSAQARAEGNIPAVSVERAEKIRTLVMNKILRKKK